MPNYILQNHGRNPRSCPSHRPPLSYTTAGCPAGYNISSRRAARATTIPSRKSYHSTQTTESLNCRRTQRTPQPRENLRRTQDLSSACVTISGEAAVIRENHQPLPWDGITVLIHCTKPRVLEIGVLDESSELTSQAGI